MTLISFSIMASMSFPVRTAPGFSLKKRRRVSTGLRQELVDRVAFETGNTIEDGIAVAKRLEADGAHMAVLSNGMNVESIQAMFGSPLPKSGAKPSNPVIRLGMAIQSMTAPPEVQFRENYLREHALKVRSAVNMPLAYLGGIQSREGVDQAMADGFDAIAMGRALVYDAGFVNQLLADGNASSPCTACNRCVTMMYTPGGTSCVLTKDAPDPKLNTIGAAA